MDMQTAMRRKILIGKRQVSGTGEVNKRMGIRRKVLELLIEEKKEGYTENFPSWTSKIARRIGHSETAVAMHLWDLEKEGLVEDDGAQIYRHYWIKDGVEVKEEDKLADWER